MKNNYIVFKCDTCFKKQTLANTTSGVLIQQCRATENCRGNISKIGESNLPIYNTIINSDVLGTAVEKTYFVNTDSSSTTIAIRGIPNNVLSVSVKFKRETANNNLTQKYLFNIITDTQSLFGSDSTGKKLQFTRSLNETVTVLVNGIPKTDFTLSNSSIQFNTTILKAKDVVEIIVSTKNEYVTTDIEFIRHDIPSSNPWSNIKKVLFNNEEYSLFSVSNLELPSSTAFSINAVFYSQNVDINSCFFLKSEYPFSSLDRRTDILVPLSKLVTDNSLKTSLNAPILMYVTEDKILDVYPKLNLTFITPDASSSSTVGDVAESMFEKYKSKIIL